MPRRIRSTSVKVGLVVLAAMLWLPIAGLVVGAADLGIAAFDSPIALSATGSAYTVAVVLLCARTFRAALESDGPRPWWKLSGGPVSSAVWAVLFGVQAVVLAVVDVQEGAGSVATTALLVLIDAGVTALVALWFARSALRLARERRNSDAVRSG